jgi:cyclohexanone monooxygenase
MQIAEKAVRNASSDAEEMDALIIGGGFAGVYQLMNLRELGFNAKLYDMAGQLGGIWYWNRYPGARVDTTCPLYQFSREDLWRDWTYTELFPAWHEIRAYFQYVENKLGLTEDVRLNTRIKSATFDQTRNQWLVSTDKGVTVRTRYLIICTGFASKPHYPKIEGIESFVGLTAHAGRWPQDDVDLAGKRVGIVGTGASGVQLTEQASLKAKHVTLFQRTPAIALPLRQRKLTPAEQSTMKADYQEMFDIRPKTFAGFDYEFSTDSWHNFSAAERRKYYDEVWQMGAFRPWLGSFKELILEEDASNEAYAYWREKVHARVTNPKIAEMLAPEKPPLLYGTKRMPLEQWFYEAFNQDNVDLVDLKKTPILRATSEGLETKEGLIPLDIILFGTGFDAVNGGPAAIDIRGTDGRSLAEYWKDGFRTALGTASAGFPNLFFIYGPQSPAAWTNGPSTAEYQGEWVIACIKYMRDRGLHCIEATPEAEAFWREEVMNCAMGTLLPKTSSWWFGTNIPGKESEPLYYAGGLPRFLELCWNSAKSDYQGFKLS